VGPGGSTGVAAAIAVGCTAGTRVGTSPAIGVSLPPPRTPHAPAKMATTTIASIVVGLKSERMMFLRIPVCCGDYFLRIKDNLTILVPLCSVTPGRWVIPVKDGLVWA
jgi:hypothetical protein